MGKTSVTRLPIIPTLPPEFIPLVAAAIPGGDDPAEIPFNGATVRRVRRGIAQLAADFGQDSAPVRRALLVAALRVAQTKAVAS
jgi:hypothetical protein